jgi:hypothetical protein
MKIKVYIILLTLLSTCTGAFSQMFRPSKFFDANSLFVYKTASIRNAFLSAGESGIYGFQNIIVSKYKSNGDTVWAKEYVDSSSMVHAVKDILELPNNEIGVFKQDYQQGETYFSYLRLDSLGDVLTYKVFFQTASTRFNNASVTPDGNIIIAAGIDSVGPWQPMLTIIKMDFSGNILWCRVADISGSGNIQAYSDGNLLISWPGNPPGIFQLDPLGNLNWYKHYGFQYISINNGLSIDSLKNAYTVATSNTNDLVFFKIDSLGVLQWAHQYGRFNEYRWCENLLKVNNNFYLMLSDSQRPGNDSTRRTNILKISEAGALLNSAKFNYTANTMRPLYFVKSYAGSLITSINSHDTLTQLTSFILTDIDTSLINACWLDTVNMSDSVIWTNTTTKTSILSSFILSDSVRTLNVINKAYTISDPCLTTNILRPAEELIMITQLNSEKILFQTENYDLERISIYDLTGKLMDHWNGQGKVVSLSVNNQGIGLYVAVVSTADGLFFKKLILLH